VIVGEKHLVVVQEWNDCRTYHRNEKHRIVHVRGRLNAGVTSYPTESYVAEVDYAVWDAVQGLDEGTALYVDDQKSPPKKFTLD
jgi:hypothetical protein